MSRETIIILAVVCIFAIMLFYGCGSYKKLLAQVPDVEFESFSYHRGGNVTSATITATGASKTDDGIVIKDLHITADYGPFVNFNVQLKGYKRQASDLSTESKK